MSDHDHTSDNPCDVCRRREDAEIARVRATQSKMVKYCTMSAECLNRLRVIPRIIVAGYGWTAWEVISWYMGIPSPTTQQAALVTTVATMAPVIFGFYMQGGVTGQKKG